MQEFLSSLIRHFKYVVSNQQGFALITKSYTFSAGATILASEHNTNFDTLYNWANGNVDNANIKASAGISLSKLSLGDDVTFTGDFNFTNAATTDDIVTVTGSSLTTGSALKVYSNSSSTSTRNLVEIINDHASADAATTLFIQQDGDATGISIAHNGDGSHLNLSGDPTNATPVDGDIWFDGSNFQAYDGTSTKLIGSTVSQVKGDDDISTNSTSYVDMTGMSISISGAGNYLIMFSGNVYGSGTNNGRFTIDIDGTDEIEGHIVAYTAPAQASLQYFKALAAGDHTIKVQWKTVESGTVYQKGTQGERVLTVVKFLLKG